MCGRDPRKEVKIPSEAANLGAKVSVDTVFGGKNTLPVHEGSKIDFEIEKMSFNPKTYGISCVCVTGDDGNAYYACREWKFLMEGGNDRLGPHQRPGGEQRPDGILFRPVSLKTATRQNTDFAYEVKK
jgi:hypothetical protein